MTATVLALAGQAFLVGGIAVAICRSKRGRAERALHVRVCVVAAILALGSLAVRLT